MRRRARDVAVLLVLAMLVGAGCGGSGGSTLDVEVAYSPETPTQTRDDAVRVDIYLVESCSAVQMGQIPASPLASTYVLRDGDIGTPDGELQLGEYGLYAITSDATCAVIAAGCEAVTIDSDTVGPLSIAVSPFPGVECAECNTETGQCLSYYSGNECASAADGTSCMSRREDGVCRRGACCTGCWDGFTCQPGDSSSACGDGGEMCRSVFDCNNWRN